MAYPRPYLVPGAALSFDGTELSVNGAVSDRRWVRGVPENVLELPGVNEVLPLMMRVLQMQTYTPVAAEVVIF